MPISRYLNQAELLRGESHRWDRVSRREFHRIMLAAGAAHLICPELLARASSSLPFTHPGILHSAVDLERMRDAARMRRQPIATGFDQLRAHPLSSPTYEHHNFGDEIGRNPSVNFTEFDMDASAAYQCSLMAAITGESRYANIACTIVAGWSGSLQRVSGADAVLMAGLGPFKLVNAAEILRSLDELSEQETAGCAAMLQRAILPAIVDFAPFANGNWDTAALKTMLAIAVFCNDQRLFERALVYYLHGDGDGRLTHYIYENGQCQESGRDQQHTQLGLGHLGDACQIAWNQGWNLFGAEENRLLKGFEYTAEYNLGGEVNFRPDVDRTGKYRHTVISPRSSLRPIYEQVLAHYHVRRGVPAPNVMKAVERIRPEGAAQGADHTGFGTLLYARTPEDSDVVPRPVPPAGMYAGFHGHSIELDWVKPCAVGSAILERTGLKRTIDTQSGLYLDNHFVNGQQYAYRLSSPTVGLFASASATITAGIPNGWTSAALGNPATAGDVQFDGKIITVMAAGRGLMQPDDEGHFVAASPSSPRIEARFIPQVASQFATFGLARRPGFGGRVPCIALLITPDSRDHERPGWYVRFVARDLSGGVKDLFHTPLAAPVVTYGRLVKPIWFRLEAKAPQVEASFSVDGAIWNAAGNCEDFQDSQFGLVAASGVAEVTSSFRFEIATN